MADYFMYDYESGYGSGANDSNDTVTCHYQDDGHQVVCNGKPDI